MKNYVGLSTSPHDSSLAIVSDDGEVLYAEGAERPLQSKRAWGCAPDHIDYVSRIVEEFCDPSGDTVAALTWSRHATWRYRVLLPWVNHLIRRATGQDRNGLLLMRYMALAHRSVHELATAGLEHALARQSATGTLQRRYYDHHLTHAASAAFASPFDAATCVVVDGFGEGSSLAAYTYREGRLQRIRGVGASLRASLGFFYARMCDLCGFDPIKGEEWKMMGLAAYGNVDRRIYRLMRPLIRVSGLRLEASDPERTRRELEALRRRPEVPAIEYADFAATAQLVFSETLYELLRNVSAPGGSHNLVLAGGCALNSSTNGGILENTPFAALFVGSAPADDGNALGAALLAYHDENPRTPPRREVLSPYLGGRMKHGTLENLRRFSGLYLYELDDDALFSTTARALAAGRIVGWVQGRAEFGPRALGNRSILADPRGRNVKERINAEVKFREEFRPFAPAVLHERGAEFFENYQFSPYMERTLSFRPAIRHRVPGAVHVDGTGRLQSVTQSLNPRFHRLIEAFGSITGVPLLVNTSFNVMGKPIIDTVEDAIAVFQTSGLDLLVIGNTMYAKREERAHEVRADAA